MIQRIVVSYQSIDVINTFLDFGRNDINLLGVDIIVRIDVLVVGSNKGGGGVFGSDRGIIVTKGSGGGDTWGGGVFGSDRIVTKGGGGGDTWGGGVFGSDRN